MKLFQKNQRLNRLYFEYDKELIIYNYGKINDLQMTSFETDLIKIIGENFFITYLDEYEIRIKGKINNICIK